MVGAHGDDNAGGSGAGAAYVFVRDGFESGVWSEAQKLVASDGSNYDMFGQSMALSGEVLVVGTLRRRFPASLAGAAYIFARQPCFDFPHEPTATCTECTGPMRSQ